MLKVFWYLLVSHHVVPAEGTVASVGLVPPYHFSSWWSATMTRHLGVQRVRTAGLDFGDIVIVNCFFSLSKESFRQRLG